jgi:sugar O-acyltransferase (sialic acid O-acetyltransferase NeuD family)
MINDKTENIILIGGGGHCKSVIDVIESNSQWEIFGILDNIALIGSNVLNYRVIGSDEDIKDYINKGFSFHITIGHIQNNQSRKAIFQKIKDNGGIMPTIIASTARVSKYASIEEGCIIMHHAHVNAGATVGKNCIINSGATIEHDVTIHDHCHISTGAYLNGNVTIEKNCFIGSQSTVIQGIKIAEGNIIGAGTVVLKSTTKNALYAGNPAQLIKNLNE